MKTLTAHLQRAHRHGWIVGLLGIIAGLALMLYVPSLNAVSNTLLFIAGFHLVGAVVLAASVYVTTRARFKKRSLKAGSDEATYDFGWAPGWVFGPLIAALIMLSAAVAVQIAAPEGWPAALLLTIMAVLFFAGHVFARSAQRLDHAALPMVDLLSSPSDLVLDGGCGAGRTTITLGRAAKQARFVALDRFDANYIAGGGRALLEHNLKLANMRERVDIKEGDLTQLPFPDGVFDSAISAHAMDHLGQHKALGLGEMYRALKPAGRFLLVVWVPGWTMFSVANILSLFLTSKAGWKRMVQRVGFSIQDEGMFNGMWFLLLKK